MWMGGTVPLGYRVHERKLVVIPEEAETVRLIFRRYAELGSVALLRTELDRRNVRSKRREGAAGRLAGGQRFSRGALYLLLQNPLYRGEVKHKDKVYPGQHDAIVDADLWQIVQDKLAAKRRERSLAGGAEAPSLFSSLIFDSSGNRMSPTHAVKKGKRYRYYVSAPLITQRQRGRFRRCSFLGISVRPIHVATQAAIRPILCTPLLCVGRSRHRAVATNWPAGENPGGPSKIG
jgi:site-specific DNA recombinase